MRGVYTAGLEATLIESGLDFPHGSGPPLLPGRVWLYRSV